MFSCLSCVSDPSRARRVTLVTSGAVRARLEHLPGRSRHPPTILTSPHRLPLLRHTAQRPPARRPLTARRRQAASCDVRRVSLLHGSHTRQRLAAAAPKLGALQTHQEHHQIKLFIPSKYKKINVASYGNYVSNIKFSQ